MPIKDIELVSFRNHDHIKFEFGEKLNVIWGANGTGKTSVLEAIHALSVGKSFRPGKANHLLKKGKKLLNVTGTFIHNNREEIIQLNQTDENQRRFLINKTPIKHLKELIGNNPVVILSPEEQKITKGGPSDRRAFYDKLFSVISKSYVSLLADYYKILKQRNMALQQIRDKSANRNILESWDRMLIEYGLKIWSGRNEFYQIFSQQLKLIITQFDERFKLDCKQGLVLEEEDFALKLNKKIPSDIIRGRTSIGPQTEKFEFFLNGEDLREIGSQGEHKLALVLIKLAEFHTILNKTKKTATFLLDDLFAKLDFNRSSKVLSLLGTQVQTIITTTDLLNMKNHGFNLEAEQHRSFHLEA